MKKEEKLQVDALRSKLISLECPLIEEDEDTEQVRSLLLDESEDRQHLFKWALDCLLTEPRCGDDTDGEDHLRANPGETLKTVFGLHFDSQHLAPWELLARMIKAKNRLATEQDMSYGSEWTRIESNLSGQFSTPIDFSSSNAKSNLIPRDLEKDVAARTSGKKSEKFSLAVLSDEAILPSKQSLQEKIVTKQETLKNASSSPSTRSKGSVSSDAMTTRSGSCVRTMDQFGKEFELDLKPWTDRVKPVATNKEMEKQVQKLHDSLSVIKRQVSSNDNLRKQVARVSEMVKNINQTYTSTPF